MRLIRLDLDDILGRPLRLSKWNPSEEGVSEVLDAEIPTGEFYGEYEDKDGDEDEKEEIMLSLREEDSGAHIFELEAEGVEGPLLLACMAYGSHGTMWVLRVEED